MKNYKLLQYDPLNVVLVIYYLLLADQSLTRQQCPVEKCEVFVQPGMTKVADVKVPLYQIHVLKE